jgi:hypothetical protein
MELFKKNFLQLNYPPSSGNNIQLRLKNSRKLLETSGKRLEISSPMRFFLLSFAPPTC